MDFGFSDEQRMLRASVRALMEQHAPPSYIRAMDREARYPYELYERWVEAGLLALPFPEAVGGIGGSVLDLAIVVHEIARHSADAVMAYGGSVFCGLNIARKGSAEQQAFWLPRILDGSVRMAIGISEPEAGSDVGAMRTRATKVDGGWRIDGQKLWVTGAGARDTVINLYCITDPAVDYRKGMSLLLVDNDADGVELRKLDMLGRLGTGTYEVFFRDVFVPDDRVIGGVNRGWDCVLAGLQAERAVSAAGSSGAARATVELALQYAKDRVQFGKSIGANQAIAHMLADMHTEVEAAELLTWRAAWQVDQGADALREITQAKLFASETYAKVANLGMQIMGAYGYSMEYDMQRHFRESRSSTIAAGTSQMQRNIIAGLLGVKVGR